MISDKSGLSSRLGWILDDTEQTLEQSRQSFTDYMNTGRQELLETALAACREVLGILDLLEAEGAYMLNREIALLMDALRQGAVDNEEEASTVVAEGLLQLSEYLKHLHDGYADLPVILLPMLNNLRAARKAELLSEHLVFLPADGAISNEQIGTDHYVNLPQDKHGNVVKRLRFYLQKALLLWFKNDDSESGLQAARKVTANMLALNKGDRPRSLWWVTGALLQALEQKGLESSVAVKMLMGRMEREIRRFGELGEEGYNNTLPDELLKNLLYYIGLAEDKGDQVQAVKQAYHLDIYLPKGETLEELRRYYSVPGHELWQSVAGPMQEELNLLMSQVAGLRDRTDPAHMLGDIAKRTESVGQALGMLGLNRAAELTEKQAQVQFKTAERDGEIEQPELEQMSEHYLKLEKVLAEYAETGYDLTDEVFATEGIQVDTAASREVVRNMLTDMSKVQSAIGLFTQETSQFSHIDDVIERLTNINGALDILGHIELQPLAEGAVNYLTRDILHRHREPAPAELDVLADIITLLDASLSCIERREDYLPLIPTGYEKLVELEQFTGVDLLGDVDMEAAQEELETKKKARQKAKTSLFQRVRDQSLLNG